jgi:transcriptional regulator with XRE-family HTH domain
MRDPSRFPVSCRLDAAAVGTVTATPAPSADLGPEQDGCGPPMAVVLAVEMAPAPQPVRAVASVWIAGARPPLSNQYDSLRESEHEAANTRVKSGILGASWQAPAYSPDHPSLSIRFVVHETGRGLDTGQSFGRHVRSLRRARGMTQEVLAERSGLSADTIRRLEHGSFSPSLETLRKLCIGLDLMLSTLFESFELGARNESRELADLLATRTPRELVMATRVLRALFDELDGIAAEAAAAETAAPEPDDDDHDP